MVAGRKVWPYAHTASRFCQKRGTKDAVVELVVEYSVPDITDFVLRVEERQGPKMAECLFIKGG
jgi:hypothetical protein